MFKSILRVLIAFFMLINPAWPGINSSYGRLPKGKTIDLNDFTLVWSDEFEGDKLDMSKWSYEWWVTERKGGYWHQDMVSVEDGDLVIRAEYKNEGEIRAEIRLLRGALHPARRYGDVERVLDDERGRVQRGRLRAGRHRGGRVRVLLL